MDEQLKNQWAADVPASDPRFVLAVMTRIEQRRFARELATILGIGAVAALFLALLAPTLEITWETGFAPYASNFVIALILTGVTIALPQFFPSMTRT